MALDLNRLKAAGNVLRVTATALGKAAAQTSRNLRPASFRVFTPAPTWTRSAFNGLAQAIVQSQDDVGAVVLESTEAGSKPQSLSIETK